MSDTDKPRDVAEFAERDLTGARFRKVHLNDARFRMVDLSGAQFRDVSLAGASIDGSEIDGLRIDGVEVGPLVEAELDRRDPARVAYRNATDPAGLQQAWAAVEARWQQTYDRVAALPPETVDVSVDGEWSFAQTLRHLVMATDAWLGAARQSDQPFHPWGVPFSDLEEFVDDPADLGLDVTAAPSYAEVLDVRADRVAQVRNFLAQVTGEQLSQEVAAPVWGRGKPVAVYRCIRVIFNEESAHRRFAERDLDAIEAGSATP